MTNVPEPFASAPVTEVPAATETESEKVRQGGVQESGAEYVITMIP